MIAEWTEDEEQYLQKIHLQAYDLYRYWNNQNSKYKSIYIKYNIPLVLLSGVNTVVSLVLAKYIAQQYVLFTTSCLSLITTLMSSINHLYEIDDRYVKSLLVSIKYYKLYLKISRELSVDKKDRLLCGRDLLNICHNEYMDIYISSDPIYTNELTERLLIPIDNNNSLHSIINLSENSLNLRNSLSNRLNNSSINPLGLRKIILSSSNLQSLPESENT